MRLIRFSLLCLSLISPSFAQDSVQQQRVNAAIESAKQVCLVGSRFKFSMTAAGQLTITKLKPGGDVSTTVDAANASGGVLFEKEEIRQLVDADIRKCMSEQWKDVLKAMEGKSSSVLAPLGLPSEYVEPGEVKKLYVQGFWTNFTPAAAHSDIRVPGSQFVYDGMLSDIKVRVVFLFPEKNYFGRVWLNASGHWNDSVKPTPPSIIKQTCTASVDFLLGHLIGILGGPSTQPTSKYTKAPDVQERCVVMDVKSGKYERATECEHTGGMLQRNWQFQSDRTSVSLSSDHRTDKLKIPKVADESAEWCSVSVLINRTKV